MGGSGRGGVNFFFLNSTAIQLPLTKVGIWGGRQSGGWGVKFFFVEIQLPFICHFNEEGAEGPQNGPKGRLGPQGPPSPPQELEERARSALNF